MISGQDFPPERYNANAIGIPYITGASNILNNNLVINRWTSTPSVIATTGDLLVVCKGSGVGKMCKVKIQQCHIARQIQSIRDEFKVLNPTYIEFFLLSSLNDIVLKAQGVIPGISRDVIQNLLFPVPPLMEQEQIVLKIEYILPILEKYSISQEKLDKLNTEINAKLLKSILQEAIQGKLVPQIAEEGTAQELLEQIKEEKLKLVKAGKLKKSALTDSVIYKGDNNKYYEQIGGESIELDCQFDFPSSWTVLKLMDVCQLTDGEKRTGQGICLDAKYLRGKDTTKFLKKGKYVYANENIILVDGENSGEVFTIPEDGYMGSTFKQLWLSTAMSKPYVLSFILYYKEILRNSKKGAAIPHLNKEIFYNLLIGIPPLEEQKRIVNHINELSQLLK